MCGPDAFLPLDAMVPAASTRCPQHGLMMPMEDHHLAPGACWYCTRGQERRAHQADGSTRAGWREVIAPGAFGEVPRTVPLTWNWGPRVGTARVTQDKAGLVVHATLDSSYRTLPPLITRRSLPDQMRYLARMLATGQATPYAAALTLWAAADQLEQD